MLARPDQNVLAKVGKPLGEWNDDRIRAEGFQIQIWLNGVQTVDFTEKEPGIEERGLIALQTHRNATSLVPYRDLMIKD